MLGPLVRSTRPHQWTKNLFVLAPLVFAGGLDDAALATLGALALAAFIAASSAVYLVNDLFDRERDRLHPVKKNRPLASGELGPAAAIAAAVALAAAALWLAFVLGQAFLLFLLAYLGINLLYSSVLKRIVIVDVMTVALGFVIRVAAGAAAIGVEVSNWILLCTIFFALLLSCTKRRHEIQILQEAAERQREVLASYSPAFLDQLIATTTATTLLCYALYAVDERTTAKFGSEVLIYTVPFVVFGVLRYLYIVYQAPTRLSPTEAVLRDPPSVVNVLLWMAVVTAIIYLV